MVRFRSRGLDRVRSAGLPPWASFLGDIDFDVFLDDNGGRPETSTTAPAVGDATANFGALEASEAAYRVLRADLAALGVRFHGLRTAIVRVPELVQAHIGSVATPERDPLAALNAALWRGGSFLYVPPGVRVPVPLQAEIREDYAKVEPFERNLLVVDRGAEVTFIEGCTAPVYTPERLHVSSIEVVARPGARVRYIALQNFAREVDNLVTKCARVEEGASVEWVDVNLGSHRTRKMPRADLVGPGASAAFVGVSVAANDQTQDAGAEMIHLAPGTRSRIENHAVVGRGGRVNLRSTVRVTPGASDVSASVTWSSLMLDPDARAEAVPSIELDEADAEVTQEGRARKLSDEMLFYMGTRGLSYDEALRMVVLGVVGIASQKIPFEYAVEIDRLVELGLSGGVG